jgi:hypothetical protein
MIETTITVHGHHLVTGTHQVDDDDVQQALPCEVYQPSAHTTSTLQSH